MIQTYDTKKFGLVNVEYFDTVDEAKQAATNAALDTFAQACPVTLFEQGGRLAASTAIPAGLALNIFATDPVASKASLEQVKKRHNRPIDKDHVKAVSDYLVNAISNGEKYILPSLTVTATKQQKVFTIRPTGRSTIHFGYIVLSMRDRSLTVTDGQHRLEGIRSALNTLEDPFLEKLEADGISIMFSFEDNINQVHQDFADCAKTKALPKSLLAVYDRRLPVNNLILDALDHCPLFSNGKTDSTGNNLSKKSASILLTNQLRNLMKSLFTGNHSQSEDAFEQFISNSLSSKESIESYKSLFISTINYLTEYNPVLKAISLLEEGPSRQKIVAYRENYLIANPAGLSLACKAIYKYMSIYPEQNVEHFVQRLMREIDWSKDADIWKGNVITHREGKKTISSQNKPFAMAINAIAEELNITLDHQEILL